MSVNLFVPGRICLFGEHSDWAAQYRLTNPEIPVGYCIISGTNQGVHATAEKHPNQLVLRSTISNEGRDEVVEATVVEATVVETTIEIDDESLLEVAQSGNHWSYIAGTFFQVKKWAKSMGKPLDGLVLDNYLTDLPVQKGLSSSAAICVLTARALSEVYDLNFSVEDEMELAFLGETTTPSQCGRMDQGCAYGSRPSLLTFDGESISTKPLNVSNPIHLVLVDLGAHKDTPKILADLNACYPAVQTATAVGVRHLLGAINHEIIPQALIALEMGDAEKLGSLMTQAQNAFKTYAIPACPDELTAPVLHELLANPLVSPYIYGGKGVGSQGDGSAQFVAKSADHQRDLIDLIENRLGMQCLPLTLGEKISVAG